MKNLFTSPAGVAFLVTVLILFCVRLHYLAKRRAWKSQRKAVLETLIRCQIKPLKDLSHTDPKNAYDIITDMANQYHLTNRELGLPLHDVLGHAMHCQKKLIVNCRFELESADHSLATLRNSGLHAPKSHHEWAAVAELAIKNYREKSKDLFYAEAGLICLNAALDEWMKKDAAKQIGRIDSGPSPSPALA